MSEEIRPEILEFAKAMEKKLREHDVRRGDSWMSMGIDFLWNRLQNEEVEYWMSVGNPRYGHFGNPDELVDIANFCMFLHHRLNGKALHKKVTE